MEPTVPCTEEKMTSPAGEKESGELGTNRVDTMPKSNQSETLPVPPVPTAKVADRPHILTIVLTTMAIVVSALSAYVAYSAVKLNLESLILIQKGAAVHSVHIDRISRSSGETALLISIKYKNPSRFSLQLQNGSASVLYFRKNQTREEGMQGGTSVNNFAALLMTQEEGGFSFLEQPTSEQLAQADSGENPIMIDGSLNYGSGADDIGGYTWRECYAFKIVIPCPIENAWGQIFNSGHISKPSQ
jgi:hypothetical protein